MNETVKVPPVPVLRKAGSGRAGTMIKMLVIGGLMLALLIPLMLIYGVLSERVSRRDEAVGSITSSWGEKQRVCGPVWIIPYQYTAERTVPVRRPVAGEALETTVTETRTAHAYFLPEKLFVAGKLDTERRKYGIYETVLFHGALKLEGQFAPAQFSEWKVKPEDILWNDAMVAFHVSDLRGAQEALTLAWNGKEVPLQPGSKLPGFEGGVFARIGEISGAKESPMSFSMGLLLNGSEAIEFSPVGRQTEVTVSSGWPDPKFQGAFLPVERTVSPSGFTATWRVSYYGRSFPQAWTSRDENPPLTQASMSPSLFGVSLLSPVDHYRLVDRSIKYGILFILLVFTAFFLFEVLAGIRVHLFQYTLVGAALVLFFLLLLALSEVMPFETAYIAGAAACSGLITLYCARTLRRRSLSVVIAAELAAIYGFLFVILRQQDYALLLGASGLFVALGIVMFATRNIDWYGRDEGRG